MDSIAAAEAVLTGLIAIAGMVIESAAAATIVKSGRVSRSISRGGEIAGIADGIGMIACVIETGAAELRSIGECLRAPDRHQ